MFHCKRIIRVLVFVCLLFSVVSCFTNNERISSIVKEWQGKTIVLPSTLLFNELKDDSICLSSYLDKHYKIIDYTDSNGCVGCRLRLFQWKEFVNELDSFAPNQFVVLKYINTNSIRDTKFSILQSDYRYPVCFDISDSLNLLNHFPNSEQFHCFLLDENNEVLLVGNPILNSNIKELYFKTIAKGLNLVYNTTVDKQSDIYEVNLGTFSKFETKSAMFTIPNESQSIIEVDTIFTSCDCTTASIDMNVIKPYKKGLLSVKYTPDGIGEFYREVYVKFKDIDKPKIFTIRGNVE